MFKKATPSTAPLAGGRSDLDHVGPVADYFDEDTPRKYIRAILDEPGVRERALADAAPLPPPHQRVSFRHESLIYWLSGLKDARDLRALAEKVNGTMPAGPALDFGASAGRVARHWSMDDDPREAHACEITGRMVDWMDEHLKGRVHAHKTGVEPPLPFEDDTFGLVYAHSVFTHIDEHEGVWLAELARVTRPDGLLVLTVHDEEVWNRLPRMKFALGDIMRKMAGFDELTKPGAVRPDRLVHTGSGVTMVFMTQERVRRAWSRWFEVIDIISAWHAYQAAVVLRPKKSRG